MRKNALQFGKVSKNYGKSAALREVDLSVRSGECFGLTGVNGAGKTTLLKCLLDFCEVNSGVIEIFGIGHRHTHSRARLAYLPERFNPPYYLTGGDFLDYVLKLQGISAPDGDIESRLHSLDLDATALTKPVRTLSKGMTQKLGLAACFLSKKDLLVLDEPMSGLDPKARALVKSLLATLRAEGRTVFFTSHSLADVAEICDHMAVLHDGRIHFFGSPGTLSERYPESNIEAAFLRCIETGPPQGV